MCRILALTVMKRFDMMLLLLVREIFDRTFALEGSMRMYYVQYSD
jgi:hypothetical protein